MLPALRPVTGVSTPPEATKAVVLTPVVNCLLNRLNTSTARFALILSLNGSDRHSAPVRRLFRG